MANIPKHIAIIMDGNGRWAQRRMLPRVSGHHRAVETTPMVVQHCIDLQIPILTLFAFSSENKKRPVTEVKLLMSLLQNLLLNEVNSLHSKNVKLRVIGDVAGLAPQLQKSIDDAHALTCNNTGLQLNIALNYGGRWDIVQAAREVTKAVLAGVVNIDELDEDLFNKYVCLSDLPAPDLLIRTSGEQRVSNFLLWQIAYTEIYFSQTLWPDFTTVDLDQAIDFFSSRQRRFGLVAEQLKKADYV
jgi:undecaprenyl diphosphate synthase